MFTVHCSIVISWTHAGPSGSDCIPPISPEEWTANAIRRLETPSRGKRSVPHDNPCVPGAGVAPRELEISRPGSLPPEVSLRPKAFQALRRLSAIRCSIVPTVPYGKHPHAPETPN